MVRAYAMIDTGEGTSPALCERIRTFDGVTEAHVVAGDFDIVVELEGDRPYDLQRILTREIRALDGVGTTRTYVVLE
ncbi:Lrp/AsnC ligand binding domain-containing protein [Natronoarchaeum mannanilyticum]|uniref:Lrp/AsnC ligand binding domain-containing protein n=1 Tax=Natronoarchaeum mannanilyticum TaxID=926360 RepID=A0AAV3T9B2_9EURY